MKRTALVLALAMSAGCTTSRHGKPCVGLADTKEPGVQYEISYWNLVVGALLLETLIVPTVVVAKDLECPL